MIWWLSNVESIESSSKIVSTGISFGGGIPNLSSYKEWTDSPNKEFGSSVNGKSEEQFLQVKSFTFV